MQFKQTTIRAIALISFVVILGAIGGCALSLTADSAEVTKTPNQAYAGDTIEITVAGFPGDYSLPADSVTIGGVILPLPGIDVDTDGGLSARFRVPSSYVSHSGGSIISRSTTAGTAPDR